MKLLEYQAKEQFLAAGIPVKEGKLARTVEQVVDAARLLGPVAVKAQVPIGGRGKAGGIKLAKTPEEAKVAAEAILGMDIKGYTVHEVWCEQAAEVMREIYLGVTLDRDARRLVVILSAAGGMEIEEVAETTPEKIVKFHPHPWFGAHGYQLRAICFQAGLGELVGKLAPIMDRLYKLAVRTDALTCEVNPLAVTTDGEVIALDGKLEVDENAEFRHQDLEKYRTEEEGTGDPLEIEAKKRGLTYVHLDGDVGVLGNGAGLVMNTLDLVKAAGGAPANFLDIGGGAKAEVVKKSLEMILLDANVKSIFINIFGGITRGDEVARGIVAARDDLGIKVPLVVRMTGTAEEEGRRILSEAGITPGVSAPEAAAKAVELARGGGAGMSILVDRTTRLVVQGMTGREGTFHTEQMQAFGTKVVAGVSPGKGDTTHLGVPVFNTVADAIDATQANTAAVFVPPPFAADAIMEAADAGVGLVVAITEGIPVLDMVRATSFIHETVAEPRLVGGNCPGLISPPEKVKVGIIPNHIVAPGNVGVVSRSGTLTYEILAGLKNAGLGVSTCVGIGGDPVLGLTFKDVLGLFASDPATEAVVMAGEIGGSDEEAAAALIASGYPKPVYGFIAGHNAPPGKRMGHAGAIISGNTGTAQGKVEALNKAGVEVADTIEELVGLVRDKATV